MLSASPLPSPDRSAKAIDLTSTMSTLPHQNSSHFHLSSKIARSLSPSTHDMALTRLQCQKRKLMNNRRHKQNQGTWFGSSGTTSVLPRIAEESDGSTGTGTIMKRTFRNTSMKGNGIGMPMPPPVIRRRTAMSEIRNIPRSSWVSDDIRNGNRNRQLDVTNVGNGQENRLEAAKQRFIQKHGNRPEGLGLLSGWPNAMGARLDEIANECTTSTGDIGTAGRTSYTYGQTPIYSATERSDKRSTQEVLFDAENRYYGFGIQPEYAPRRPMPRLREATIDPIPEAQDEVDVDGVCKALTDADFSSGAPVEDEWVPKAPVRRRRMPAKVQMIPQGDDENITF